MKSEFRKNYYAIADAIEAMRDLPMSDNFTACLLKMRMELEEAGEIVKKELGAWD